MNGVRQISLDRRLLWTLAFLLGLVVRMAFVPYKGTADMDSYLAWGRDVATYGLAKAYHGIYFPLEYQLFRLAVGAASVLGISEVSALKIGDLAFDGGTFALLVLLLRRLRLPPAYALIYWLHPYFLAISWLGYIDMHSGFMIVASLLAISYASRPLHYVADGVPLGLAFMMKPQGITFVFAIVLVTTLGLVVSRMFGLSRTATALARHAPLLLVAPVVLFCGYSLWVAGDGHSVTYLAHTYSPGEIARQSESLNANMTNIWYPVADALREHGAAIYTVTEPTILNAVGTVLTLGLISIGTLLLMRRDDLSETALVTSVFGLAAIVGPMTLTHVHENHLYFGALLATVLMPLVRRRWFTVALNVLLALQFINLAGRYRLGLNHLSHSHLIDSIADAYGDLARLITAWLAIASFAVLMTAWARWANTRREPQPVSVPDLGIAPRVREGA
jgi:hypothetical protein